ncbi:hypothetical protein TRAPUB_6319 [Trametes pubescens]|uniref:Uncharacterized protein n=1 Tax=Trametes pubescens TaxID=154538 RepID=A0A1M2W727_TRAPU|nr:hypothetical protein TRAPUB_6319 [Trametes pubescens]
MANDRTSRLTTRPAPAALKKKQGVSSTEADDLFAEEEDDSLFGDDLFGSSKPSTVQPTHVDAAKRTDFPPHNPSVPAPRNYDRSPPLGVNERDLAADDKKARFEELYQFAASCIADKSEPARQMRTAAWHHLFSLAGTPEELERVAELFPKWRDARRSFRPATPVQFARRCEELHCPQLALKVFGNHSKYGLDLTLDAARPLLHGLHLHHPLQDTITLTALFSVYKLPPVSSDLVCSALLLTACFKHASDESLAVARALVPSFQQLLAKTEPAAMALQAADHGLPADKEKRWLAWTLKKVEKALQRQELDFAWLRQWRVASGYAGYTGLE